MTRAYGSPVLAFDRWMNGINSICKLKYMNKIRTLIIDDESLARDLLRHYLAKDDRVEVIGECANGFEGVLAIQELKPDLVFLDIQDAKN